MRTRSFLTAVAALALGGVTAARAADMTADPDLTAARHRFGPPADVVFSAPLPPAPPAAGSAAQPGTTVPPEPAEGDLRRDVEAALPDQDPLDPAAAAAYAQETQRKVDEEARKGLVGYDPNGLTKRLHGSEAAVDGWLSHLPPGAPRSTQAP